MNIEHYVEGEDFELLPLGIYNCEIVDAVESVSKSNNEMIIVTLEALDEGGGSHKVKVYLLTMLKKRVKDFCECFGLKKQYENKIISSSDCVGKRGNCEIDIEQPRQKDGGGFWPQKNIVTEFISVPSDDSSGMGLRKNIDFDDEVPF